MEITLGHTYRWHATTEILLPIVLNKLKPKYAEKTVGITLKRGTRQGRSQDCGGGGARKIFFRFGNLHDFL